MISYILNSFIPALITSSIFIGIATWLLKKYLSRRIDNAFNERERILESRLRQVEKHKEKLFDSLAELLPEIQEVVYRSRNCIREIIDTKELRHFDQLLSLWNQLSDHLYKYQVFLPEDTFRHLHDYKRLLQNIVMMLSHSTNDESDTSAKIREKDFDVVVKQMVNLENLYKDILEHLRKMIQNFA